MSTGLTGSNSQGPLRGDRGMFEDLPLGWVDRGRTEYKVWIEEFDTQFVDGLLAGAGATVTDINTATTPTEVVTGAAPYLLIDPGTKADSGTEVQFNAAPSQATYTNPAIRTVGPITSTTTLMVGRELFWFSRVGFLSNAATWDGAALVGWFATDTSLMSNTTGVISTVTGGGIGFHLSRTGVLSAFCQQISAATTIDLISTGVTLASGTANLIRWYTLGFRAKWGSAGTIGTARFYVNEAEAASVNRTAATSATQMPMASTQVYSATYGIHNGTTNLSKLAVGNIITGITRPVV